MQSLSRPDNDNHHNEKYLDMHNDANDHTFFFWGGGGRVGEGVTLCNLTMSSQCH